jgi:hypothetical protein
MLIAAAALLSGGCANPVGPAWDDTPSQHDLWTKAPEAKRIETLRRELAATCPRADPDEVAAVAGVAVRYGELVRYEYGLFRPVEVNNILIQMHLKRRGLCFQLADDLFCRLRAMQLRTLDLHQGQAAVGHLTEEHNCVVVTDKGKPFRSGMVLDLWRYAGKLRWITVAQDTHDWRERPTLPPPAKLVIVDYAAPPVAMPRATHAMVLSDPDARGDEPCRSGAARQ